MFPGERDRGPEHLANIIAALPALGDAGGPIIAGVSGGDKQRSRKLGHQRNGWRAGDFVDGGLQNRLPTAQISSTSLDNKSEVSPLLPVQGRSTRRIAENLSALQSCAS